ncbi:MAG: glucuronate isomerase, partial [Lachnospiraceae bacterium]|nr:glucuronate isomerase [Lachnospiraceae bacterium]
MKPFMDEQFLLGTKTAQELYANYADMRKIPVVDYHCHINPQEIFEDRKFENIAQVWLGGDHYKWRQMRTCGVDEKYITGDASDHDKFVAWAKILPMLIGNPLYHWSHLELRYYFGYQGNLNEDTAEEVWNLCNEKLRSDDYTVRGLIRKSNVRLICTTDDPADSLIWHEKIKADETFDVQVLPAWRPDKAMNIEKADFAQYMRKLSEVSGVNIGNFSSLKSALKIRMDHFAAHGCSVSDHAPEYVMYERATPEQIEAIFQKALQGSPLTDKE